MRKKYVLTIAFLSSCIGPNHAFLPETISESKKQNIFLYAFKSSQQIIKINNDFYQIQEVWATKKKKKKYFSNEICDNFFCIRISLKNLKTDQEMSFIDYIDNNGDLFVKLYCLHNDVDNLGIIDNLLTIDFDSIHLINNLESFKIGFIDSKQNEKLVQFNRIR